MTAALALTGCSIAGAAPAPDASPTRAPVVSSAPESDPEADPAPGTVDPMDADAGAAATCGQISALDTISLNATIGQQAGELTDAQVEALSASVRFGYEHLVSDDPKVSRALDAAQRYLREHPAPASGPAFDDDTAEWDLMSRTLTTACRESGSNVVTTAASGG